MIKFVCIMLCIFSACLDYYKNYQMKDVCLNRISYYMKYALDNATCLF